MTMIETTTEQLTEEQAAVQRGAAWLDDVRPGWDREINLAALDLNQCDRCVIGQLYGHFYTVKNPLGDSAQAIDLGFNLNYYPHGMEEGYARLTEAWRDEIARRRTCC